MLPHDEFAPVRKVLLVDALTCTGAGLLMALGAGALSPLTQLPEGLLRIAGLSLFPVAALFGWMAVSRALNRPLLLVAVMGNAAWVAGSLAVLAVTSPSTLGYAFVLAQAAAVAGLAVLEARALKAPGALAAN